MKYLVGKEKYGHSSLNEAYLSARLNNETITETLEEPIPLTQPATLNGKRCSCINSLEYMPKRLDNFDILEAIYPMNHENLEPNGRIDKIILHHTGDDYSVADIIRIHMSRSDWAAIGYHYIIDREGNIILTRDEKFKGAHVYGQNSGKIGIAFCRNLDRDTLNSRMLSSYYQLRSYLLDRHNLSDNDIMGHNQSVLRHLYSKFKGIIDIDEKPFLESRSLESYRCLKADLVGHVECHGKAEHATLAQNLKSCPGINAYFLLEAYK